jgi:hypothetical protein
MQSNRYRSKNIANSVPFRMCFAGAATNPDAGSERRKAVTSVYLCLQPERSSPAGEILRCRRQAKISLKRHPLSFEIRPRVFRLKEFS